MTRGRAGNFVAQKNELPPQGIEPDFPVVQPWPIYVGREEYATSSPAAVSDRQS